MATEYTCHVCERNVPAGHEFISLEVRVVEGCGTDSAPQDATWVLCSKGCVRKALPRIEPMAQYLTIEKK